VLKYRSLFFALVFVLLPFVAYAADYEGTAIVVDGDTIELHVGNKIIPVRLCGIDSPEARHAGGPEASAKMAAVIALYRTKKSWIIFWRCQIGATTKIA
jgi:endonuclease YncB( thermonuclease family)